MATVKRVRLDRSLIVVACFLALVTSGCFREARYESFDQAQTAGAFEQGWIPRILPPSATDIRVVPVIDTNETWGVFSYSAADSGWTRGLSPLHPAEELDIKPPPNSEWWDSSLRGNTNAASMARDGFEVFRYQGDPFHAAAGPDIVYFFVSDSMRTAYFWRPSS
jgi:hypothetical protein